MPQQAKIQFNTQQRVFYQTLHKRIDQYFKTNGIVKNANAGMVFKTLVMFALYFVPYFLLIFNVFSSMPLLILLAIIMGFGIAGIGLSVMHDANHGSYSSNRRINKLLSYTAYIIGGHTLNWQLQHNTLHHTFTNIEGHDIDITPKGILRFSPHAPYKKIHRYQFIYAWFLYGLMTVSWLIKKDFLDLARFEKMGMLKQRNKKYKTELIRLIVVKLLYCIYMIGIPILTIHLHWWQVLIGFLIAHYVGGFVLALIFQAAHVVEDTKYPLPDESGNIENDWAVHQLYTTANFAPKSRLLSWYAGALNYQVEHHLFPTICHIHYRKIAPVVKQTAEEFNYPYLSQKTFMAALASHARMLFKLGREPQLSV